MPTIDLSTMSLRTANEVIKGFGAQHEDVEILNPDARHYIAVGLTSPIHIHIRGSAGYFCGGLTDGPRIRVEKNVSWGVGDNMLSGSIVVKGNAGAIAGVALRGGEIVVEGHMGSRAGQVMKKGTLCCAGNCSFMAGYMMYGGRIIIVGDSGIKVGEDMAGGEIYVGGSIDSLGNDAVVQDPAPHERESVRAFLDGYGLKDAKNWKKIVCGGGGLKYASREGRSWCIPFDRFSGRGAPYWNEKVRHDIRAKGRMGRYRVRGYGAARHVPHFTDLAFGKPLSFLADGESAVPRVNLRTFIGGRHGGRALDLSMPVMIAPMSYGAVSGPMKIALGMASRLSGISENTGEGGMHSVERAEAQQLIAQCLSGRLGWNIHDMKRADALELYISQGAKPGLGGQLMASKLTEEIARTRGIPRGMDLRSPSRHPDVLGGDDLIMKVQELREAVGWRLPVGIKLGGGRTRDDIKIAFKDGLDFVELDGLQGGTGAAADEVLEYVGIPTLAALMEAQDGLAEIEAQGRLPIIIMGGMQSGVDVAKAIALGASAVGIGTGLLIAAGCVGCMQCSSGQCPAGIATQDGTLTGKFDIPARAWLMHRYLESLRSQLAAVVLGLGHTDVRDLSRKDLVALTPEASEMTRLPHDPSHGAGPNFEKEGPSRFDRGRRESGSANFSRKNRTLIAAMARSGEGDELLQREILMEFIKPRENPFPRERGPHLDDLVFLSAALTRLVIDPYREECSTRTRISRSTGLGRLPPGAPCLQLEKPFLATGFDGTSPKVKAVLAQGLKTMGCAYVGRAPLVATEDAGVGMVEAAPWLQLLLPEDRPAPGAAALIAAPMAAEGMPLLERLRPGQLLGGLVDAKNHEAMVLHALDQGWDMLLVDTTGALSESWAELVHTPRISLMRDVIATLRGLKREEEIALVNFGGMRSGTDVSKALAMNFLASVFGVAAAVAMGAELQGKTLVFRDDLDVQTMEQSFTNWIRGTAEETAIIARCTGKTNVHNLEPEDMRSISMATRDALGIPLASGRVKREGF